MPEFNSYASVRAMALYTRSLPNEEVETIVLDSVVLLPHLPPDYSLVEVYLPNLPEEF